MWSISQRDKVDNLTFFFIIIYDGGRCFSGCEVLQIYGYQSFHRYLYSIRDYYQDPIWAMWSIQCNFLRGAYSIDMSVLSLRYIYNVRCFQLVIAGLKSSYTIKGQHTSCGTLNNTRYTKSHQPLEHHHAFYISHDLRLRHLRSYYNRKCSSSLWWGDCVRAHR